MLFSDSHIEIMNSNLCFLCVISLCSLWFLILFNHKVRKEGTKFTKKSLINCSYKMIIGITTLFLNRAKKIKIKQIIIL